jgi:prophage regulatory protein
MVNVVYWIENQISYFEKNIKLFQEEIKQLRELHEQVASQLDKKNKAAILLSLKEVLKIVPVARSTWLAGVKDGRFPKPIKITGRTFWDKKDIIEYIENQKGEKNE